MTKYQSRYLISSIICLLAYLSLLRAQSFKPEFDIDSVFQEHTDDTLICLTIRSVGYVPFHDTTFGNKESNVFWRKILFCINKETVQKKLYSYASLKSGPGGFQIFQSGSLLADAKMLLPFLRQNLDSLKRDEILPFIACRPAVAGKKERYIYLPGSFHEIFYTLEVLWSDGSEVFSESEQFSDFELSSEQDFTGYKNLNFEHNQASYFKQLFDLIKANQPFNF
jgi:hypothetical protein